MKLTKYQKNKQQKRITIVLLFCCAIIFGIVLGTSYASYQQQKNLEVMNGNVEYFGNSDVYFAFYNGEKQLTSMPEKGNAENLGFSYADCTNGATVTWNYNSWSPTIRNLTQTKTKCKLYFAPLKNLLGQTLVTDIPIVDTGNGLYEIRHEKANLEEGYKQPEYRYAGTNYVNDTTPYVHNYVTFNNEVWRIIGLVNVKEADGTIGQRVKIVRNTNIGNYTYNDIENSDWTVSKLKIMLNDIYYRSESGACYKSNNATVTTCDFSQSSSIKGLNSVSQTMIDDEVIWNIGSSYSSSIPADEFYELERGTNTSENAPFEWTKENDPTYHNGVGLIYPSDYGYGTNGGEVGREICLNSGLYQWNQAEFYKQCSNKAWFDPDETTGYKSIWTMTPYSNSKTIIFYVDTTSVVSLYTVHNITREVYPAVYLKPTVKISSGTGEYQTPYTLEMN